MTFVVKNKAKRLLVSIESLAHTALGSCEPLKPGILHSLELGSWIVQSLAGTALLRRKLKG